MCECNVVTGHKTVMNNALNPDVLTTPRKPGMLKSIRTFLDMIKFSHSIFAMPFALIATFLAARDIHLVWPGWIRLGLIVLCMVLARTFAMTFNRLVDRDFDSRNPRAMPSQRDR